MTKVDKLDLVTDNYQEHLKNEKDWKTAHELLHETQDTKLQHDFHNIDERFNSTQHVINTACVIRDNTDYKDIKSVIHFGDIVILSEKKFCKLTRWLYNKLFGWTIEDYHWGIKYQRSVF